MWFIKAWYERDTPHHHIDIQIHSWSVLLLAKAQKLIHNYHSRLSLNWRIKKDIRLVHRAHRVHPLKHVYPHIAPSCYYNNKSTPLPTAPPCQRPKCLHHHPQSHRKTARMGTTATTTTAPTTTNTAVTAAWIGTVVRPRYTWLCRSPRSRS